MSNMINIKFMTDSAIDTLKENQKAVTKNLKAFPNDASWLSSIVSGEIYEEKKYKIPDFELSISDTGDYSEVDYDNSIKLYESLKGLPRYILTDERFWAWINFEKGYQASLQAMPIKSDSTFSDHWLFTKGTRRGFTFGVLSRCFLRVDLSVDEDNPDDKYWLTKFVIENPERFRNLTWRASSSERHIVKGTLKAEYDLYQKCKDDAMLEKKFKRAEKGTKNIYTELSKYLSLYGSVRLIDVVSEEDVYDVVTKWMTSYLDNIEIEESNTDSTTKGEQE